MAHDVFISYSSGDKAVADATCAALESRRIRCWIAPRDVTPGLPYAEALVDGINQSRVFVLVFSSAANSSPQVMREVERAVSRGIPIIPLRIEDVLPTRSMEFFLSTPHWLDALTPPLERHLARLAQTVDSLLAYRNEALCPPAADASPVAVGARMTAGRGQSADASLWKRRFGWRDRRITVVAAASAVAATAFLFLWFGVGRISTRGETAALSLETATQAGSPSEAVGSLPKVGEKAGVAATSTPPQPEEKVVRPPTQTEATRAPVEVSDDVEPSASGATEVTADRAASEAPSSLTSSRGTEEGRRAASTQRATVSAMSLEVTTQDGTRRLVEHPAMLRYPRNTDYLELSQGGASVKIAFSDIAEADLLSGEAAKGHRYSTGGIYALVRRKTGPVAEGVVKHLYLLGTDADGYYIQHPVEVIKHLEFLQGAPHADTRSQAPERAVEATVTMDDGREQVVRTPKFVRYPEGVAFVEIVQAGVVVRIPFSCIEEADFLTGDEAKGRRYATGGRHVVVKRANRPSIEGATEHMYMRGTNETGDELQIPLWSVRRIRFSELR